MNPLEFAHLTVDRLIVEVVDRGVTDPLYDVLISEVETRIGALEHQINNLENEAENTLDAENVEGMYRQIEHLESDAAALRGLLRDHESRGE